MKTGTSHPRARRLLAPRDALSRVVQRRVVQRRAVPAALAVLAPALLLGMLSSPSSAARTSPVEQWSWPLAGEPAVLRSFDPPAQPWLSGHRGVDLAAAAGAAVLAPADGVVSFVGTVVNRPVITIAHPGGVRSSFESVDSPLSPGDAVAMADVIGTVAEPWHCGTAACLHWGVRRGGQYINPLAHLADLRPSVLLPLPG